MMTSVVADATRGNRDRVQPQTSHTSQPQKQIQATAEQIRLAQMIDKNDADFEGKVKQLIEVTSRNQDECMVALHDCNGDVNRAINFLLEEVPAKDSWETVGKKKSVGKEGVTAETKERRVDKEGRGRGGPNRRGRGASRTQEGRTEENGFDSTPGERGERGRRGRGRGAGGRGRGRGDGVNRFSQGMGTFYTADYTGSADPGETANDTTDGAGNWRNNLEDWAAEDWNEDLSETKVFTASFALASQNHVTPGQGVDLSSLLPKAAEVDSDLAGLEPSSPEPLTQSLVFTNSQQHTARTQTHSYASAAANSYASAAAGTYAHAASSLGSRPPQPDVQKTEPVSVPRITPLSNQTPVALTNGSPVGESSSPPPAAPATLSLNEPKAEFPVTVTHMDLKAQPDPSPILSQLTQQQNSTLLSDLPAQGRNPSPPLPLQDISSPVLKPLGETSAPAIAESHQPKQIRPQRRRLPPPSKIPSSAVEMPGSADVSGLNVQFGALDFASEAAVESPGQSEISQEPAPPVAQTQSNLYSKPSTVSEPVAGLPPALTTATMEPRYTSPSLGLPTATAPAPSTSSRAESSSLHKETTTTTSATPLTNGFSEVRPSSTQDAVPSSTPQSMSTALSSENGMAASSLPSSSSSAPAPTPSTALPSLSSHVSSGTTLGSAAPATSGLSVASDVSGSLSAFSGSVLTSSGLSNGAPGLSTNGPSAPSTGRSAPMHQTATATTTGKAPPNLAQGVPPLLANQYIMGPGGLLPAYPQIYGYEDLQMMQSRLPIDYYGMTAFPGTTTLAARDGGLANNPYSGEATKFARGDAPSPAPTTSLSSVAPSQSEPGTVPPQTQAPQNPGQAFLNPPLPPGYGYTSLPYYAGMPGVPSAFQYGPTVFMPPASAKQHAQYQHQAGYGGHTYVSGFDDLSQAHAGGDYGKGYGGSSQSQAKPSNSTGKAPGLSGSASSDLGATVYSKTQSFDKQGFPTATPATFSLPSALGGTGPLNPGGAPGYAPAPFLHILPPHQQPPSQPFHHHMAQDTQAQRSQSSSMQKSQGKSNYSSSPYWAN
ncbi:ubiquitin-associated protein 2b isoform X1 [Pangasianodon hypophthalmus]|uniref:ubiquitin-associated protein 2b isoform X1 n=1 Tax=Pangasianodon hypophthalmus TaxID=310915 RepID=UPI002306F9A3|nr:ubiquitin-associated protein 2b isoform X1 [Pangasianodon hypophthalmus]XP_034162497.2 ubiquitin-associated protein 2b isoform X1 [Pangasianodon hypophthalmus]XP_053091917.1 ubiquitin-associated protein 2b isoform X1 [Pangasianodon hypophthalmus]XP_053091918.1 ubiquitin-associated protein 2b isoform X1 [Pangasianodon hypophthalmus]